MSYKKLKKVSKKVDLREELDKRFKEVSYKSFYRSIFPKGSLQKKGVFEKGKYNAIAISVNQKTHKVKRYTVTDDLSVIDDLVKSDDFCLMSPISYIGKERKSDNARYLYALAIDLDGVENEDQWEFLMQQIEHGDLMLKFIWGLPKPTYLISSGTGLHLYYVFKKPIPLYKNVVKEFEILRNRIVWQAWTQGASSLSENVQYESVYQGFRIVGTITKKGTRAKAYKVGKKVDIDYLNCYVPDDWRANIKDLTYQSELTLKEAKKKYPDWYEKRIVKKQTKNAWTCKKDLYYWWARRIREVKQGHRYWCILTLVTYAKKCNVPFEEVKEDAYNLIPFLNTRGDKFTKADVDHALLAYKDDYITYPIDTIVKRTALHIEKNKRNGRKQKQHMAVMRAIQEVINPNWRDNSGRKKGSLNKNYPKAEIIREWRKKNPSGKKIDCHRDTKLSRVTINKWWN